MARPTRPAQICELFFYWALLILPWVLVSRFAATCLGWLVLVNVTLSLFFQDRLVFMGQHELAWSLFGINFAALVLAELLSGVFPWLGQRWGVRVVALGAGIPLTMLVITAIYEPVGTLTWSVPVWVGGLGVMYFIYRLQVRDLFMLAGACLSVIVVTVAFLAWLLLDAMDALGLLVIAASIIGLGAASAMWLRRVQSGWDT